MGENEIETASVNEIEIGTRSMREMHGATPLRVAAPAAAFAATAMFSNLTPSGFTEAEMNQEAQRREDEEAAANEEANNVGSGLVVV